MKELAKRGSQSRLEYVASTKYGWARTAVEITASSTKIIMGLIISMFNELIRGLKFAAAANAQTPLAPLASKYIGVRKNEFPVQVCGSKHVRFAQ